MIHVDRDAGRRAAGAHRGLGAGRAAGDLPVGALTRPVFAWGQPRRAVAGVLQARRTHGALDVGTRDDPDRTARFIDDDRTAEANEGGPSEQRGHVLGFSDLQRRVSIGDLLDEGRPAPRFGHLLQPVDRQQANRTAGVVDDREGRVPVGREVPLRGLIQARPDGMLTTGCDINSPTETPLKVASTCS